MTLSIVVPVLDEAPRLPSLARHLRAVAPRAEVCVVDGGSTDGTVEAAEAAGLTLVHAPRGRGVQMNAGAERTSGDTLLFLHADTALPVGVEAAVDWALVAGAALGSFTLRLDDRRLSLRIVEWGVAERCRWIHLPLGDQALFCRRETFDALGGFAPLPFLEDMDFVRRARALGPVVTLPDSVVTSARVWRERGVWRTTAWNGWVTGRFLLGWRPQQDKRGRVR